MEKNNETVTKQEIQIARIEERVSSIEKEQVTQNIRIDKLEEHDKEFLKSHLNDSQEKNKKYSDYALRIGIAICLGILLYFLKKEFGIEIELFF